MADSDLSGLNFPFTGKISVEKEYFFTGTTGIFPASIDL